MRHIILAMPCSYRRFASIERDSDPLVVHQSGAALRRCSSARNRRVTPTHRSPTSYPKRPLETPPRGVFRQGISKKSRDMQLQVSLADLVVFDVPHRTRGQGAVDPSAPGDEDSAPPPSNATPGKRSATGFTWGVRFEEEGSGPIVVTTDASMYDKEVEAQMAAAAAKVTVET